ncbi:MAG: homing endonuclease associated repeat-containing protein [Candidatus Nealsonbacteria bacterium]|nr:MAG: hypothetical protein IB617_03580 [Candidatus Nealsonbacteria bacterium]
MSKVIVKCSYCKTEFQRELGRYNEAIKKSWNQYCSQECQNKSKIKRVEKICGNPKCNKRVSRKFHEFKKSKSGSIFCSLSCAVSVNNSKFPKRQAIKRKCLYCEKDFVGGKKYCSIKCKNKAQIISKEEICDKIKGFYKKYRRIPVKKEFSHYNAARDRFGSWNKAIESAGFVPNPVVFARKHKAEDGHVCDSLSEKIVDDWLSKNNLKHKINVAYPGNPRLTCDFLVGNYFIEFFGIGKEHVRYTELMKEKRRLAQQYNLNMVELKPEHIFPKNKLDAVLNFLL